jgi:hypothetical protein
MESKLDTKVKLSLLWIVIIINMIYNDIFSIMVELVNGNTLEIPGDVTMVMSIAAIITNIPIFMIILSRILNYKLNRIFNIVAGFFTILYVIGGGDTAPHYLIVATIEIILSIIIIISAWKWKPVTQNDA